MITNLMANLHNDPIFMLRIEDVIDEFITSMTMCIKRGQFVLVIDSRLLSSLTLKIPQHEYRKSLSEWFMYYLKLKHIFLNLKSRFTKSSTQQ